jgi:hypothetical protein
MVNLLMYINFNSRIGEVSFMHLELRFLVILNAKLTQPQMHAVVSILSQI